MNNRNRLRCVLTSAFMLSATYGYADQVVEPSAMAQNVQIENLQYDGATLRGEIVNRTGHPVNDVQLLVTYAWLWRNEFKPGADDPGWGNSILISDRLAPNEVRKFMDTPDRLPTLRTDGKVFPSVHVVGYTEFKRPE